LCFIRELQRGPLGSRWRGFRLRVVGMIAAWSGLRGQLRAPGRRSRALVASSGEGWRMQSARLARLVDVLWVLVFGVLGSLWCVTAGERLGPTFDEPFYLEAGLHFWHTGSCKPLLDKGAMPLPMVLCTAPVRAWELCRGRPVELSREFDAALFLARPAALL